MGFPGGTSGKEPAEDIGDVGWIPRSVRSTGGGHATHSSIPYWRTHEQRSLMGYSP